MTDPNTVIGCPLDFINPLISYNTELNVISRE
jgi:hypothetical protein